MPGVYGIQSDDLALRNRVKDFFVRHWGEHESASDAGWTIGAGSVGAEICLRFVGGSWVGCDGEPISLRRLSSLNSLKGSDGDLAAFLRGNVFVLDQTTDELRLECHESGYLPLFWFADQDQFVFASSLRVFREVLNLEPDPTAVVTFLRNGFTIGDSSPLAGVHRVLPGQVLRHRIGSTQLTSVPTSRLWAPISGRYPISERDSVNAVWSDLVAAVDASYGPEKSPTLMLSGGWDSRTLLAATLETGRAPRAFVHGDPNSREIALVQQIAGHVGIDLIVESIGPQCMDPDWLNSRFDRVENVVFPHWHRGAEILAARGSGTVASGIFGEVLGGHYGPSMALQGWRKIFAVGRELVGTRNAEGVDRVVSSAEVVDRMLHPSPISRSYYLQSDWWDAAGPVNEKIRESKEEVLDRYIQRGIRELPTLVEAYITEHRGAQYIAAQPGSMRADLPTTQPFVESELLRLCSAIPIQFKIHNSLNRLVLSQYSPGLAALPLAATLVKARRPVLIQEASRLARRIGERIGSRLPALGSLSHLSWVNFEFMRSSPVVLDVIDSLSSPWWDRDALRRMLTRMREDESRDLHPYFDQLMKIYTIDALFRS